MPAVLSLATGAALLSLLIFFLRLSGFAGPLGMLALGVVSIAPLLWFRIGELSWPRLPWLFTVVLSGYGLFYTVQALAPETRTDANVYHLTPAVEAVRSGGFEDQISFYERLPQGMENLFAMGYSFGGSSSAKLIHLVFFLVTFPVLVEIGRRLGASVEIAASAAAMYICTPVAGVSGTAAFTDAALVFYTAATLLLVLMWRENYDDRLIFFAGLLAGFCYCCKITGLLVPISAAVYLLAIRRSKSLLLFGAAALVMVAPWMIRNTIEVGNPFAPLLNTFFPNAYFHIATEEIYSKYLRTYGGITVAEIPLEITIGGDRLQGLLGPMFLLAPLAFLALRRREGRIVAALAALLAVPWFFNLGTRFLMQSIPFVALAMIMPLPRLGAYALLLAHAITCAPPVLDQYAPAVWHPEMFPLKAALRIESEADYMQRVSWDYRITRMVEANTNPADRILDLFGAHLALLHREVVGSYQTALGDNLSTGFELASVLDRGMLYDQRATFSEQPIKAIRVRQTASTSQTWSIHDIEVFRSEQRIRSSRRWTLDAWPNSWEAPLAFDQNLISRWRTWEPARPGMYLEVDFDRPQILTSVNVVGPSTENESRAEIFGQRPDDSWTAFPAPRTVRPAINLRRSATRLVRRAGMRYILVAAGTDGAGSIGVAMVNHKGDWGLEVAAHVDHVYLLKIP